MSIFIFRNSIPTDAKNKALRIKLFSVGRPYMRAFHFSWLAFMVAFFSWFSISPLMPTIKKELQITPAQAASANMTSVSATILARILIGPLCDLFGPRRVMASLLIVGAIPTAFAGLVSNGNGLIAVRFFIGILGAAFVPCQFWTTQMFSPPIVGSANAFVGGWGNMGAGITYLVMPLVFQLFKLMGLTDNLAWRVTLLVPAFICILVGIFVFLFSDDWPGGHWRLKREGPVQDTKRHVANVKTDTSVIITDGEKTVVSSDTDSEASTSLEDAPPPIEKKGLLASMGSILLSLVTHLLNPNVVLLMLVYACSFGLELAVDNVIGEFFHEHYKLDQTLSGIIGSIFGLMNLFSRASGGLLSDFFNRRMRSPHGQINGRLIAHILIMTLEGVTLIAFGLGAGNSIGAAIALMILFSYFVQAACGTTFGIVPFIDPGRTGAVAGLIGAGGNIGGVIFNAVFGIYGKDYLGAFMCVGYIVLGVMVLSLGLRIHGGWIPGTILNKLRS
ncbi:uncharacterized protein VTP21DRAFT_9973 [Calcarisporiella thermophila]|uniref:uncharacterized protein n=1 Tax=Calcarisporiella thermophila TaxID=911321 RepID=UPI00374435F8